jgi:hypothetical protein
MNLKVEVIQVLEREKKVSEAAIARLREKCRLLEQQYGWPTHEFLKKFNAGEIGDEQEFFRWYALAEALKDWQATHDSVAELLAGAEVVGA